MTLKEIIEYVDRKKPNTEILVNKIADINKIQLEIFMRLDAVTYIEQTHTDISMAGQEDYELPTDCQIENIRQVLVEDAPASNRFTQFLYASDSDRSNYYQCFSRGETDRSISLYHAQKIFDQDHRIIKILYLPRPTKLTVDMLEATPDLKEEYHPLLCYGLIVELSNQGSFPDSDTANYYQQKFDEFFVGAVYNMGSNRSGAGARRLHQSKERW